MLRTVPILMTVSLVLTANLALAEEKKPVEADKKPAVELSNPSKVIVVNSEAPKFTLTLKSNPTTGYTWVLVGNYNDELIKPVSHAYHAPDTKLVGAPGYETFTFKVKDEAFKMPQLFSVSLQYVRPWVAVKNAQKMTFTIVTTDKPMPEVKKESVKE